MGKVFRNVSTNGRVTVPSVVRNALEIHSGDILSFEITDGAVTVRKEKFDGDSKNAVQSFIELDNADRKYRKHTRFGGEWRQGKNIV